MSFASRVRHGVCPIATADYGSQGLACLRASRYGETSPKLACDRAKPGRPALHLMPLVDFVRSSIFRPDTYCSRAPCRRRGKPHLQEVCTAPARSLTWPGLGLPMRFPDCRMRRAAPTGRRSSRYLAGQTPHDLTKSNERLASSDVVTNPDIYADGAHRRAGYDGTLNSPDLVAGWATGAARRDRAELLTGAMRDRMSLPPQ